MENLQVSIADNIKRVRESIAGAAIASGREPGEVTLLAAAKTRPAESVRQAIAAGIDAVGENRVQEMLVKHAQGAYAGAPLHFIGHLQSNKVKSVVGVCDLIESVGSPALIESIGKQAASLGIVQNVLIEVNIGREPQKSGVLPEHLWGLLDFVSQIRGVSVLGLMAIPPIYEKIDKNCNYFDVMFQLFVDMSKKTYDNVSVRFLSMGMSDSYIDAIRAGSNMVRVGSAIFGSR